jgi:homoserine dehydrogenase
MTRPELVLLLAGFGHVGRRLVGLLDEMGSRLAFSWRVGAISTRRHGSALSPTGLDAARAAAHVASGGSLAGLTPAPADRVGLSLIREACRMFTDEAAGGRLVLVETTVLNVDEGEPAMSHVQAALEARAHVVTANKGPAAIAYRELAALAARMDRRFLFEGAVMDGLPVFNLVRETMPGVRVESFRGVINTTCQHVITALANGREMADAVADMQASGIAEADPSLDLDGWDAAAKAAVLANVLLDGTLTPSRVTREGVRGLTGDDVRAAARGGRRLALVASGARHPDGGAHARVRVESLSADDPLAALRETDNALYLTTDLLGEVGIVQRTSTLTQTAYALVSDLTTIGRGL